MERLRAPYGGRERCLRAVQHEAPRDAGNLGLFVLVEVHSPEMMEGADSAQHPSGTEQQGSV